ncbi:hypothetical protein QFZ51_005956 [Chitinophaga sp. W3I9]
MMYWVKYLFFLKWEGLKKRKARCVTAGLPNIFLNETWHCNTDQELIPCHHQCLFVMIFCIARTKMKHFFRKCKFFLWGAVPSAPFVFLQDYWINRDCTDFPTVCWSYCMEIKAKYAYIFCNQLILSAPISPKYIKTKGGKISAITINPVILQKDKRRRRRRPSATVPPSLKAAAY